MGLSLATALACSVLWLTQHDFTEPTDFVLLAQATNEEVGKDAKSREAGTAKAAGGKKAPNTAAKDEP